MIKFGIQNGLNVARAGYSEDQILTACLLETVLDMILFSIWTIQMYHKIGRASCRERV